MRKVMMMTLGAGLLATAATAAPALNPRPDLAGKGTMVEKAGVIMPQKTKSGKAAKKAQKKQIKKKM